MGMWVDLRWFTWPSLVH